MNVLFIHPNFPAQFIHHAAALAADPAHRVIALSMHGAPAPAGIEVRPYRPAAAQTSPQLAHAHGCGAACAALKARLRARRRRGPHGLGDAMFVKDVFPAARFVAYAEFFYDPDGPDATFDPAAPPLTAALRTALAARNAPVLHALEAADVAIAPTAWQRSLFPPSARERMQVLHDGIDMRRLAHRPDISLTLSTNAGELTLRPRDEVLTYVARNLEPGARLPDLHARPARRAARPSAGAGRDRRRGTATATAIPPEPQDLALRAAGGSGSGAGPGARAFHRRVAVPALCGAAGGIEGARLPDDALRPVLVLPGSGHERPAGGGFGHAAGAGIRRPARRRNGGLFDHAALAEALVNRLARPASPHRLRPLPELDSRTCTARLIQLL